VSILLVECLQIDEHAHKIAHISGSLTPIGTCRFRSGKDPKQWGTRIRSGRQRHLGATHNDAQNPPLGGSPSEPERRLNARLYHGPLSYQVIALATSGQLGAAAAGQIRLAVVTGCQHRRG
jgi:hypothetical protein